MSSLIRWDPFREGVSLRTAMDRLFDDSLIRPDAWLVPASFADLAVDVYETKDDVVVKAALAGVKPEDAEITITGNTLQIRGESKEENEVKEENYIRKERRYGSFSRTVTLPEGLKNDKAEATFEHGMLTLRIPKSEESKPKTIKVRAKK
jgi:HSP20 family protein